MIERKKIPPEFFIPAREDQVSFSVQNPGQPGTDPHGPVPGDLHELVVQLVERDLQFEEEAHTLHEKGWISPGRNMVHHLGKPGRM
jgi:hypothetical protein